MEENFSAAQIRLLSALEESLWNTHMAALLPMQYVSHKS